MRLGCGGCLTSLVLLSLLATGGGALWGASRALEDPAIPVVRVTAEDATRAQQKLFRLLRGSAKEPVVLSEAELTAFVSRSVDQRDLPFEDPLILLHEGDVLKIVGRMPLAHLLAESPLSILAALLPARWSTRAVWLQIATRAEFEREPRRQLRLDIRRVTVGRQRLPVAALLLLLEPARLRFVRMTLPETVADVRIEAGRAVIQPTSSRERT